MTTYTKTWKNYVWLAWFTIQVPIITCKLLPHPTATAAAQLSVGVNANPRYLHEQWSTATTISFPHGFTKRLALHCMRSPSSDNGTFASSTTPLCNGPPTKPRDMTAG